MHFFSLATVLLRSHLQICLLFALHWNESLEIPTSSFKTQMARYSVCICVCDWRCLKTDIASDGPNFRGPIKLMKLKTTTLSVKPQEKLLPCWLKQTELLTREANPFQPAKTIFHVWLKTRHSIRTEKCSRQIRAGLPWLSPMAFMRLLGLEETLIFFLAAPSDIKSPSRKTLSHKPTGKTCPCWYVVEDTYITVKYTRLYRFVSNSEPGLMCVACLGQSYH